MALTAKDVQEQLLRYFNGDIERVKLLVKGCNALDFKISDNLESIQKNPEHFTMLITYSDLGILGKLADTLAVLKGK